MDQDWRLRASFRAARELRNAILDCLLPPHCCACGERLTERVGRGRVCRPCGVDLEPMPEDGCVRCGEAVAAGSAGVARCGRDHRAYVGLAFAAAAYRYRGSGGAMVRRLKLEGDFAALDVLGAAMARAVAPRLEAQFRRPVLASVPLHRARRRQRGFDQAGLLAEAVARRLGLEVARGALARVRPTIPQGDARVASREQNVAGVFVVVRPAGLVGRTVLLVDDVMTSGATARACAERLREAGVGRVALLTACRARNPSAS